MAMGTRKKRQRQHELWMAASDVVQTPANAFYDQLNGDCRKAAVRQDS